MLEAWRLRAGQVRADEERLRERLRNLADGDRARFYGEYNRRLKDPDTYAVLNWFFLAGLHHLYLGRIARGAANLLIMGAGFTCLFVQPLAGVLLILLVILLELPALFRSQVIVADYNNRLARELLDRYPGRGHPEVSGR